MTEERTASSRLLLVGRVREITGDHVGAVMAYRHVILAGDAASAGEARRRLEDLVVRWAGRPV